MIDWDRVTRLRAEVGPDEFRDVVALFLEEADALVERLRTAGGGRTLADDLHFLKGSALNLGFAELVDLCRAGEALATEGRPDAVDLAALVASYGRARASFLAGAARLLDPAA